MSAAHTPADLHAAGYRIEFGTLDTIPMIFSELHGRYWWTFAVPGPGSDTTVSLGDWATVDEAAADARADLTLWAAVTT